jgi:hypothetical protein
LPIGQLRGIVESGGMPAGIVVEPAVLVARVLVGWALVGCVPPDVVLLAGLAPWLVVDAPSVALGAGEDDELRGAVDSSETATDTGVGVGVGARPAAGAAFAGAAFAGASAALTVGTSSAIGTRSPLSCSPLAERITIRVGAVSVGWAAPVRTWTIWL